MAKSKELKIKRMKINGETNAIKYDMCIDGMIYIAKTKDFYTFYFPTDAENSIYIVGFSCPVKVLDSFVDASLQRRLSENSFSEGKEVASVLENFEIGE